MTFIPDGHPAKPNDEHTDAIRVIETLCPDYVQEYVASLLATINSQAAIIEEVHSWAVCGCIASAEDMAQNIPHIAVLTLPKKEKQ